LCLDRIARDVGTDDQEELHKVLRDNYSPQERIDKQIVRALGSGQLKFTFVAHIMRGKHKSKHWSKKGFAWFHPSSDRVDNITDTVSQTCEKWQEACDHSQKFMSMNTVANVQG